MSTFPVLLNRTLISFRAVMYPTESPFPSLCCRMGRPCETAFCSCPSSSSFLECRADAGDRAAMLPTWSDRRKDEATRSGCLTWALLMAPLPDLRTCPCTWPLPGGAQRATHSQWCTPPGRAARPCHLLWVQWGQDCQPGLYGPVPQGGDLGPPPSKAAEREGARSHTTSCILSHAEPFCGKKALGWCLRFRKTSAHACTQHTRVHHAHIRGRAHKGRP